MPMTIDENLAPAAILEFHSVKDHGGEEGEAWQAAVARVRYDVLLMAVLTCEERGRSHPVGSIDAATCHECAAALRDLL